MAQIVVRQGCCKCCDLVGKLDSRAKQSVVHLGGTECCGFLGLGDVVEAAIHLLRLHIVWAYLHGKKSTWVCPGCQRRKTWLNKHFYYGNKEHKALWLALVTSTDLAADAQYPFLAMRQRDGSYRFRALSDCEIERAERAEGVNYLLEEQ